ncbi:MAG: hypothetical protein IPJ74_19105 [Saprospiraceae bacterium]|nr:hypothetical protein [Saprospiraceae bacterium]
MTFWGDAKKLQSINLEDNKNKAYLPKLHLKKTKTLFMQNHSNIHGNHNIVLQDVSNSTITLKIDDDKIESINNNLTDLKQFMERQGQKTFTLRKSYTTLTISMKPISTLP